MNKPIILNQDEHDHIDWKVNWSNLVTFEDYMSIRQQQEAFERNEKGYESNQLE